MSPPALRLFITSQAQREIEAAATWWRENRTAPDAIAEELARVFPLIQQIPGLGAPARSSRLIGVRRVLLDRIGYFLYYRVSQANARIEVLRFWHMRRGRSPALAPR